MCMFSVSPLSLFHYIMILMSTGERAPIDGVLKLSTDFVYIIFSHSWFQDITDFTNFILLSLYYIPVYACLLDFECMNEINSNYTQINSNYTQIY
jgi:hypothetical protein